MVAGPMHSATTDIRGAGATDILLRIPSWEQKAQVRRLVEEVLPYFA